VVPNGMFLDGGGNVGLAIMSYEQEPRLIHRETFVAPRASSRAWGFRWWKTEVWLQEKVDEFRPAFIGFEAPYIGDISRQKDGSFQSSEQALRYLIGVDAIFEMVATRNGIECSEVTPSTAKVAMTGSGRPGKTSEEQKRAMKAHAIARGYLIGDEHQADAVGVGLVCIANYFRGRMNR
jgi:Holliday junction resolvasome RuvABC endonuclease subunit